MPTFAYHASAAAAAANLTKYSELTTADPDKAQQITGTLSRHTSQLIRMGTLGNPSITPQFLCMFQGKPAIISQPTIASDDANTPIYLAGLGDTIEHQVPISLPAAYLTGYVVTLIAANEVEKYHLPVSEEDPMQLEAPPPTDGGEGTPPGPDRLNFPWNTAADAPKIACIPVLMPLPPGVVFPDGIDFADRATLTTEEMPYEPVRVWYKGMRYLVLNNAGTSLHLHDGMFNWADLSAQGSIPATTVLATLIQPPIVALDPFKHHYTCIRAVLGASRDAAILRHAATTDIPDAQPEQNTAPPPGAPAVTPDNMTVLFNAAVSAVTNTGTSKEREQKSEAADVEIRYKLLFASIQDVTDVTDGTVTREVQYPALTPIFRSILEIPKTNKAVATMQEQMQRHCTRASRSDHRLASGCTLHPTMFDSVLVTALRRASIAVEPPAIDPDGIVDKLGLYHFASPRTESVLYKERLAGSRRLLRQEVAEEDTTRLARKTTELYRGGYMETGAHIHSMLANFWNLGTFMIVDFVENPPALSRALAAFDNLMRSPEGRRWLDIHRALPHVFHSIAMDLQQIFCLFASLPSCLEYRDEVRAGRPIAVLAIDRLTEQAQELCRKFQNIIPTMALGDYATIPTTLALFRPPGTPPASQAPRHPQPTPPPARPPARGRQVTPPAAEREPAPDRHAPRHLDGLLKYSGSGRHRPMPDTVLPHPTTGTPTKICRNHIYHGASCQWGNTCRLAHITSMRAVPSAAATHLRAWVTATPTVSWTSPSANGQSP